MKEYRDDIDGLRALAVLAVVCYHLNPRLVPGGFIGVDIFFVISGFLITKIVWDQIQRTEFSIINFYKRRVVRLFPALFMMLSGCVVATYFISHPFETQFFGKSLIASIFYVSNIFYLSEASYFTADPNLNPLLHTWSLAVEEQFYLFYPVLLVCIHKFFKSKLLWILLLIGLGSFLLSISLTSSNEDAAFLLAPSRFYQLLIGGIVALLLLRLNSIFSELSVIIGLVMLVTAVFFLSDQSVYPGINALLPTFGAVLILLGGNNSVVSNFVFSNVISRLIGKMSYSIYLWHWPIIVFYKIALNPTPKRLDQIGLFAVTLIISYFSWRLVENPARWKGILCANKEIFNKAATASIIGLFIGSVFIFSDGLRYRFSKERLYFAEYTEDYQPSNIRGANCFLTSSNKNINWFTEDRCIKVEADKQNILLLGDSHINRLYYPMRDNVSDASISQVTASGCRPTVSKHGYDYCLSLMRKAFNTFIPKYRFDIVILFAYWKEYDVGYLNETIELISNHTDRVVIFGPMVTYEQALPRLLARFTTNGMESSVFKNARNYQKTLNIDQRMRNALLNSNAEYVSLLEIFCPKGICKTIATNGEPIQVDYGHLTSAGGIELIRSMIGKGFFKFE